MADVVDIQSAARRRAPNSRRTGDADIRAVALRLQSVQTEYIRTDEYRQSERASILRNIKKTSILIVGVIFLLAALSDLLSILDLGWLVAWMVTGASWFVVRRIDGMKKSSERIIAATARLSRESTIVRQRVMQLLPVAERGRLIASERIGTLASTSKSYIGTWVRDSIITHLIELIPVVDLLPFYLGQVAKMIINQNIEYQKVKKLLPSYDRALASTRALEQMELEQLDRVLATLLAGSTVSSTELREATAPEIPAHTPRESAVDHRTTRKNVRGMADIAPAAALPAAA